MKPQKPFTMKQARKFARWERKGDGPLWRSIQDELIAENILEENPNAEITPKAIFEYQARSLQKWSKSRVEAGLRIPRVDKMPRITKKSV